ncbi:MAG: sugar transporter, partial [Pseudomonadota bacterium]
RRKLGRDGDGEDYATTLAEFERLAVDREFAEQAYTAALATYDQALAEARRKSRYLAAYIRPTLAEASEFPRREVLLGLLAFFLISAWAIAVLIYYSVRDRR